MVIGDGDAFLRLKSLVASMNVTSCSQTGGRFWHMI